MRGTSGCKLSPWKNQREGDNLEGLDADGRKILNV